MAEYATRRRGSCWTFSAATRTGFPWRRTLRSARFLLPAGPSCRKEHALIRLNTEARFRRAVNAVFPANRGGSSGIRSSPAKSREPQSAPESISCGSLCTWTTRHRAESWTKSSQQTAVFRSNQRETVLFWRLSNAGKKTNELVFPVVPAGFSACFTLLSALCSRCRCCFPRRLCSPSGITTARARTAPSARRSGKPCCISRRKAPSSPGRSAFRSPPGRPNRGGILSPRRSYSPARPFRSG